MLPRLTLPPKPGPLALIALAFALPGLAGHDLWKTHDAIGLGIVHDMATSGTPLVPSIAGRPMAVRSAALPLARAGLRLRAPAGDGVPFRRAPGERRAGARRVLADLPRGARLGATRRRPSRARRGGDAGAARLARAHRARARSAARARRARRDVRRARDAAARRAPAAARRRALRRRARLRRALDGVDRAGFAPGGGDCRACCVSGMAHSQRSCFSGSFVPCCRGDRRHLAARPGLARARGLRSSGAPLAWQPLGEPLVNLRYFLVTGSWFAWPAWPLALWAAWSLRRRWAEPQLFVPAVASVLLLLLAAYWGPAQDVHLIPLLPPLALLGYAGRALPAARRGRRARLVRRPRLRLLRPCCSGSASSPC